MFEVSVKMIEHWHMFARALDVQNHFQ